MCIYKLQSRKAATMLTIRDEEVRTLARQVMEKTGAPTLTAAVKQALRHEIENAQPKLTLQQKVDAMRAEILGKAGLRKPNRDTIDSRDDLWDR
jgi:antitoxin VapB